MNKPAALIKLIEELHEDGVYSATEVTDASKATIYLNDSDAKNGDGINLSSNDCYILFSSTATVKRLVTALSSDKASLVLHEVEVSDAVLDALECKFVAVDED